MTTEYSRSVLKIVVAQICQTIGWHSINSTPLEFMVDLMQEYILKISKVTQQYTQILGRSEANLDDLGLAFRQLNIDLNELAEYVKNVDSVPCVLAVPKLPIHKESHLNFLKPGSREVVTRPVHVHEHLPAMYPVSEVEEYSPEIKQEEVESTVLTNDNVNTSEEESSENNNVINVNGTSNDDYLNKVPVQTIFKRPGDPVSFDGPVVKRPKTDEGRPLREIHSVMMTTSGFLSTAREGKLPEARTPHQAHAESPPPSSPSPPPIPQSYPMVPPEVKVEKKLKKIPKKMIIGEDGKPENKENKKKKVLKDNLFQPDEKVKKLVGMKELAKLKVLKPGSKAGSNMAGPSNILAGKNQGKVPNGSPKHMKNALTKSKSEKVNNFENEVSKLDDHKEDAIDKLPIEPDKQKLNIFKKISSKPKEDKEKEVFDSQKLKQLNSRENSPVVIDNIERHVINAKHEDKISNAHHATMNNNRVPMNDINASMMSPGSDVYMFDDMSSPGTPSTPKTPELNVPNVNIEQKKKKKDKTNKKKEPKLKIQRNSLSPNKARWSNDSGEVTILERPKTPQAPENLMNRETNPISMQFYPPTPGPGLIPHPMFSMPIPGKGSPLIPGTTPNPVTAMSNMLRQRFPAAPGLIPPAMFPISMHKGMMGSGGVPNPTVSLPAQTRPPFIPPPVPTPGLITPVIMPNMIRTRFPRPETPKLEEPKPLSISSSPPPTPVPITPTIPIMSIQTTSSFSELPRPEKSEKKSKEHKKEKKDKMKKKKEKKEKHKDKGEKSEKKDKIKKDKLEKIKEKKEKKEKRKEKEAREKMKEEKLLEAVPKITLKLGPAGGSPRPPTPDSALTKKITIKPPKKPDDETNREPTPELAKISALITRPPKQKSKTKADAVSKKEETKEDKENGGNGITTQPVTVDQNGTQIWICPACGKQDDGSPMIGCDACDAWYHWSCVGIRVEPLPDENWYCQFCLAKNQEEYHDKKKKKRKKKLKGSP